MASRVKKGTAAFAYMSEKASFGEIEGFEAYITISVLFERHLVVGAARRVGRSRRVARLLLCMTLTGARLSLTGARLSLACDIHVITSRRII